MAGLHKARVVSAGMRIDVDKQKPARKLAFDIRGINDDISKAIIVKLGSNCKSFLAAGCYCP